MTPHLELSWHHTSFESFCSHQSRFECLIIRKHFLLIPLGSKIAKINDDVDVIVCNFVSFRFIMMRTCYGRSAIKKLQIWSRTTPAEARGTLSQGKKKTWHIAISHFFLGGKMYKRTRCDMDTISF